ncbi:MAG TPA: hypothetical protein VL049_15600 [Candidatus Dormibacteraeota bacterium]|nr:hypothetical protein [Candidatus Dormibacteraeota bacterium]
MNRSRRAGVFFAVTAVMLAWHSEATASPFAYVPGSNSTAMTVVDTDTDTVVDTINVGDTFLQSTAVRPDGLRVYASSINSGRIWVINAFTNAVVTSVPTSVFGVTALALDPTGAKLYATTGDNTLAVMDTATNTLLPAITGSFDAPQNVAVTPDGTRAYVSNAFGGIITVVDLVASSVLTTIPTFGSTRGVDILPDGSRAYVTEDFAGLDVIDTATNTIVTTVPIFSAVGAAVHPDGSKVYVSTGTGVVVVDTATNTVITSIPVGGSNFGVTVNPDGSKAYVASYSADSVFVIDTATNMSLGSVAVASQPFARGHFIGPEFICGNGTQDPGEQCDDGNVANGDCCDVDCQFEANGSACPADGNVCTDDVCDGAGSCGVFNTAPCNDGDACTQGDICNGAGTCVGPTATDCGDGDACTADSCVSPTGCVNDDAPASGCLTAGKSLMLIKDSTDDSKDKLLWKWIKGAAFTQMDLGDPTGSTNYALCVYAGTANALIADAALPPGASWSAIGTKGYKFKGSSPDGLSLALLKGGEAGKSKALAKGAGAALPDPVLPLAYPVTVQLKKDGSPLCLESTFTSANEKKNTDTQFKAKQ